MQYGLGIALDDPLIPNYKLIPQHQAICLTIINPSTMTTYLRVDSTGLASLSMIPYHSVRAWPRPR